MKIKYISKVIFILIFSMLASTLTNAQTKTKFENPESVYFNFGFGAGIFYPKQVNSYINDLLLRDGYETSTALILYIAGNVGITYKINNFEFNGTLEYAIASQSIAIDNYNSLLVSFNRFSQCGGINYLIPFASGRHSIFIGCGISYNQLVFTDYYSKKSKAKAVGIRPQAGINFKFGKFNPKIYVMFNSVAGIDESHSLVKHPLELNYTGLQFGIFFSFHK